MNEKQFKNLMIATVKVSEHEEKDRIINLLKLVTISYQKEFAFTYHWSIVK